jgi:hypothetical protein
MEFSLLIDLDGCLLRVMPGLVPGKRTSLYISDAWMAGTGPAMTEK